MTADSQSNNDSVCDPTRTIIDWPRHPLAHTCTHLHTAGSPNSGRLSRGVHCVAFFFWVRNNKRFAATVADAPLQTPAMSLDNSSLSSSNTSMVLYVPSSNELYFPLPSDDALATRRYANSPSSSLLSSDSRSSDLQSDAWDWSWLKPTTKCARHAHGKTGRDGPACNTGFYGAARNTGRDRSALGTGIIVGVLVAFLVFSLIFLYSAYMQRCRARIIYQRLLSE